MGWQKKGEKTRIRTREQKWSAATYTTRPTLKGTAGVRLVLQIDAVYPFENSETNVSISQNQYTADKHYNYDKR